MSDQLVLVKHSEDARSENIVRRFAERTGLTAESHDGTVVFPLGPDDHRIDIVQTLTEIDPEWGEHLSLGDPGAQPSGD